MDRYKRPLDVGDEAITNRTAQRYKVPRVYKRDEKEEEINNLNVYPERVRNTSSGPTFLNKDANVNGSPLDYHDWANDLKEVFENDDIPENSRSHNEPKDLEELIRSENFFLPITTPVDISRGELFLMLLKYSTANGLSVTAMTNLLKLSNAIFKTPVLRDSRYITDKLLNPKGRVQFHAVCEQCTAYLGEFSNMECKKLCNICQYENNLKNPNNPSYFVLIDPSAQISNLLNIYENHYDYVVNERTHKKGHIQDVYDGNLYRRFINSLPENEKHNYITAVFNIDGAPKFQSAQYSIWPLYLKINELPEQDRNNKLITCGLWFNKKKPDMTSFLDKFVDLINNVCDEGISCSIKGEERSVKLRILSCCADSTARAAIQGIKQCDAKYGCNWCLHPGQYSEGGMKYPFVGDAVKNRNHDETVKLMLQPTTGEKPFGIKYPSPLINLRSFDIIRSFVPDYLHCCLEGVACQFTSYFLESLSDDQIKMIDDKMIKIAAPHQIARLCRPLSCRNEWKAREWENFTLYYSIPIFSQLLSKAKLDHWLLFVESMYILLKNDIHIDELNEADLQLIKFVSKAEDLYGIRAMTFNLHQLLHISECVLNWGPLWTNSSYSFDSANEYLLRAIKCARGVTQQIVRFINVNHSILILEECVSQHVSNAVEEFCYNIHSVRMQNIYRTLKVLYFGKGDCVENDDVINNFNLTKSSTRFHRKIVKDRCLYESHSRSKTQSNNSYAFLSDGTFIRIIGFIIDKTDEREFTMCNVIHAKRFSASYKNMRIIERIETKMTVVPTQNIEKICIFMNFDGIGYLCPLPNLLHY